MCSLQLRKSSPKHKILSVVSKRDPAKVYLITSIRALRGSRISRAKGEPMSIELHRTPSVLSGVRAFAELLGSALTLLGGWRERRQQRQALLRLDDRMLRDIGLSRADVEGEVSKPFWRG